jgi:26S proteasome regulatory subunit N8
MIVKTNDMHMAVYLASLIRSVIALHDLVNNKIRYGEDGMQDNDEALAQEEEKKEEEKLKDTGNKKDGGK